MGLSNAERPNDGTGVASKLPEKPGEKAEKPEMVRMTLDMPVEAHIRLKCYAAKARCSMVDVLRKMALELPEN